MVYNKLAIYEPEPFGEWNKNPPDLDLWTPLM